MNAEMLKKVSLSKEDYEYVEQIDASTNMLSNSYEDFAYVSSYEIIDYKATKISFTALLENRINFFNIISKVNYKLISFNIEKEIYVFINKIELERLIDNNISNAIKYGERNKIIEINLYKIDNEIILEFKTYGKEIKNTDKVFEKNYRENESKRGLGLGLNIVKNICDKYDVKYFVKSEEGINIFKYIFK